MLVHFEEHESVLDAIKCEKHVKRWVRSWKIELIREKNPDWRDASPARDVTFGGDWFPRSLP